MHDLKGCAQLYNWNRITIRWVYHCHD